MNKEEIDEILSRLDRIDHKEYTCAFEFTDNSSFAEMCECFEERKKLANYIKELQQHNKQLQARINKAIEYIKHTQSFSIVEHYMNGKNIKIPYVNGMDLLEILGESNEKNKDKR